MSELTKLGRSAEIFPQGGVSHPPPNVTDHGREPDTVSHGLDVALDREVGSSRDGTTHDSSCRAGSSGSPTSARSFELELPLPGSSHPTGNDCDEADRLFGRLSHLLALGRHRELSPTEVEQQRDLAGQVYRLYAADPNIDAAGREFVFLTETITALGRGTERRTYDLRLKALEDHAADDPRLRRALVAVSLAQELKVPLERNTP